jgi:hypothetical protein
MRRRIIALVTLLSTLFGCGGDGAPPAPSSPGPGPTGVQREEMGVFMALFARLTLEEYIAKSQILAEVVVVGIGESHQLADNPDRPPLSQLEEPVESARWLKAGVRYRDIKVRVLTPMKGATVGSRFAIRERAPDDAPIRVSGGDQKWWSPEIGNRYVVFGSPGADIWTGGVLLNGPDAAPEVRDGKVTFNQGVVHPSTTVSVEQLAKMAQR